LSISLRTRQPLKALGFGSPSAHKGRREDADNVVDVSASLASRRALWLLSGILP
jgi:hypothetical protein